jgi:hypothetical protein
LLLLAAQRFPENWRQEQRGGSAQGKAMAHRFFLRQ